MRYIRSLQLALRKINKFHQLMTRDLKPAPLLIVIKNPRRQSQKGDKFNKVLSEYTKVKIDNFEIQNVDDATRYFSLELTSEGDSNFAEVCSVDDIVDLFNELSESKRFCRILNKDSLMSSFYLLSEKTLDFLEESRTLPFVDLPLFN